MYLFNLQEGCEGMEDDVDTLQEPDIDFHDWIAKHRGKIICRFHRYTEVSCLQLIWLKRKWLIF